MKKRETARDTRVKGAYLCLPERVCVWSCIKTRERQREVAIKKQRQRQKVQESKGEGQGKAERDE